MIIFMIFVTLLGYAALDSIDEEVNPYIEALKKKPWESVQAYVEVRPGAFMFYWLYYADGTRAGAAHKPLVIWIQGGPGYAASGIGNFMEIGPLDWNLKPRNHTWVNGRNLLLLDHPVGVGFSYVTDESLLVHSDHVLTNDLVEAIKAFLETHKEFRRTPTYIFGQSYGGKICPKLAYYLHKAIDNKNLDMNLKGLGIGSAFVNPKESIRMTSEFMYTMGAIDQESYLKSMAVATKMGNYIDHKDYLAAESLNNIRIDELIKEFTELNLLVDWFLEIQVDIDLVEIVLNIIVNEYVKPALKMVNQSMGWESMILIDLEDRNEPSMKFLEMLLNETQLKIAVYNGDEDLVCPLAGASNWVHELKWPGAEEFSAAKRLPINGHGNGLYKKARQLSFWSVFGSGHWVPEQNPTAMEHILQYVISGTD